MANLRERLADNPYPGRGIVLGRSDRGHWVQVYWIMGRSVNSRNRVFVRDQDIVRTQAADPSKVEDPSLIIYNAMRRLGPLCLVTNGAQTDGLYDGMAQGLTFTEALAKWQHEPDAPNFTPRISGALDLSSGEVWLSLIKASPFTPSACEHHFYRYTHMDPGTGYTVTTYSGDGNPLPSFSGPPYLTPLRGDAGTIAATFWDALNAENRISLAVREVDPDTTEDRTELINQYQALSR